MTPVKVAWQRQKEFIANVSHELRTPLTVIESNLDVVIADQEGNIKGNNVWLDNAYSEAKNMGKLISDLLLLARIDAREIQFKDNEFDLSGLLHDIAFQFTPLFQNKDIDFSWIIEPNVRMYGDEARIGQMVKVFLDNASKYTFEDGKVKMEMRKGVNTVEILVADNGIGFDDAEKENIFRRFYRIDKARSRKQGGTGLGLAIADWIVKEHKGTIQVSSKPGKGSIFKVIFPYS
jgi:two-component system sensor histidine kinase CiaH